MIVLQCRVHQMAYRDWIRRIKLEGHDTEPQVEGVVVDTDSVQYAFALLNDYNWTWDRLFKRKNGGVCFNYKVIGVQAFPGVKVTDAMCQTFDTVLTRTLIEATADNFGDPIIVLSSKE